MLLQFDCQQQEISIYKTHPFTVMVVDSDLLVPSLFLIGFQP